ncbi:DUF58 domain-containing protein [Parahaliea mediterranea]|uniref:DUF58 domain-containing protein n=1 Tax=Parahaliea mediterranea TaxID=651086 RepID=UPI000E2E96EE|nr:DUF58 domain-containing protein [Parahaliea mediterranea]
MSQHTLPHNLQLPPRGAYCELAALIGLRLLGSQLDLGRRKRALNQLTGPNKSSFRGRGIDFEEVRGYQAGDDIRSIDWRVTARTGSAHTKLFREERERPVLIAIDQRNSLFFGSRHCFKSVLAAHLGALLAWSALDRGDRVGALLFNGTEHREIRPRRSRRNVLAILSAITEYNHRLPLAASASDGSFSDMLGHLRRVARPGSSIYLISDFHNAARDGASEHLYQLARHCEITAMACHDPLEQELPRAGVYAVTDGQQRAQLSTADANLRRKFAEQARAEAGQLAEDLQRLGIPLLAFSTTSAPFPLLQHYYGAGKH